MRWWRIVGHIIHHLLSRQVNLFSHKQIALSVEIIRVGIGETWLHLRSWSLAVFLGTSVRVLQFIFGHAFLLVHAAVNQLKLSHFGFILCWLWLLERFFTWGFVRERCYLYFPCLSLWITRLIRCIWRSFLANLDWCWNFWNLLWVLLLWFLWCYEIVFNFLHNCFFDFFLRSFFDVLAVGKHLSFLDRQSFDRWIILCLTSC